EADLRPHAQGERRAHLLEALQGLYVKILAALPLPAHRPQGWDDEVAAFAARLRSAAAGAPRPVLEVADYSARRMFDTLPIHSNMRELDEEVVYGAVRFRMIAVSQELRRR